MKKSFIYLFTDRGFGSELLTLGISIILADKKDLKFLMCSKYSNITLECGWSDYFESFCEELTSPILKKDFHFWATDKKSRFRKFLYKLRVIYRYGFKTVCMHELWEHIWTSKFNTAFHTSSNLKLDNNSSIESMSIILNEVWRPKDFLMKYISQVKESSNFFSEGFISIHVRRGDKVQGDTKEADIVDTSSFINYLKMNFARKINILVLTDDYSSYNEIVNGLPDCNVISFVESVENGYDNSIFSKMNSEYRFNKIKNLILQIELCKQSNYFIGTYTTNLSRLIVLLRSNRNCYNIEGDELRIVV